jgi:hypothetical protein
MSKRSRRHRAQASQGEARPFASTRTITAHAAGVDIGAHEIVACVPDGEDQQIVRTLPLAPLLRICRRWRTGVSTAACKRWRWHPPASMGFHSLRHEKPAAFTAA